MKKLVTFIVFSLLFQFASAQDWAYFSKYQSQNMEVLTESAPIDAVLYGNSITENWAKFDPEFFIEHNFVGRGISGQVTSQMLLRFRDDVIELKPRAVVILAGINDIAENKGPISLEHVAENIFTMAELARSHDIKVYLCAVLPANRFAWRPEIDPAVSVTKLNILIKTYADKEGIPYIDYYAPMVDDKMGLKSAYGDDGVHPNRAGYKIMENLLLETLK